MHKEPSATKQYLGDGVYVEYQPYESNIKLSTRRSLRAIDFEEEMEVIIYLDSDALINLINYAKKVGIL